MKKLANKKIKFFTLKKPLKIIFQRLFTLPIVMLVSCCSLQAKAYNYPISPKEVEMPYMHINLLGSMVLKSDTKNSLPVTELSDIAWDKDEELLYAISDEGFLYHLEFSLKDNKLNNLKVTSAIQLTNKNNVALKGRFSDAEGLTLKDANNGIKGDSTLIISFENKPRIANYSPKGKLLKKIKIPKTLRKKKYFRDKNKALESVTFHPKYGILTAAELPLKHQKTDRQTLYSNTGKQWHFPVSKAANSSITALEVLANGDVLILERAYSGILSPIVITLRQLSLEKCNQQRECEIHTIAKLNSANGWRLDNFEGLTHFRGNQYFMISDNNNSPLQKTILVLFEIVNKQ